MSQLSPLASNTSQLDVLSPSSKNSLVLKILNGTMVSNTTGTTESPEELKQIEMVSFLLYLMSFIIGAPANLYVLMGMIRNTLKIKKEVRILLIHLATADMFVMWIFVPTEFVWKITGEWLADDFTCKFLSIFRTFGLYSSSFILIAISLDRYFAIKDPLENIDSEKRIRIMVSISWIMAGILSIPQPFLHGVISHPRFPEYHQCVIPRWMEPDKQFYGAIYGVVTLVPLYFLPLAVIVFCYSQIYLIVLGRAYDPHIGALGRTCSTNQSALELQERRRRSSGEGTTIRPVTQCSEIPMPDEELSVLVTKQTNSLAAPNESNYKSSSPEKKNTQESQVPINGTKHEIIDDEGDEEDDKYEDGRNEDEEGKKPSAMLQRKVVRKLSFLEDGMGKDLEQSANITTGLSENQNGSKEENKEEGETKDKSVPEQWSKMDERKDNRVESIEEQGNSISSTKCTTTKNQVSIEESDSKKTKLENSSRFSSTSTRRHITKVDDTRRKVLRMTSLLIITFVACWTPYAIMATWALFQEEKDAERTAPIEKILYFFAVSNSCINPYLYGNLFRFLREKRRRHSGNTGGTTKKSAQS